MSAMERARDPSRVRALLETIDREATQPWTIMEVCGGQTHAIVRFGLSEQLSERVELLHGPGCPVCVTPIEMIDRAHAIALDPSVILCSYGDMLRVPGSDGDLLSCRARGADVRIVYSPLDALALARKNPTRQVVFFAVGFETTAPANAMAVQAAARERRDNFSVLSSHVLVPPSLASIMQTPGCRVNAFLGPGHVCTVMGTSQYEAISRIFRVPIAIAGFEPVDLLEGVLAAVRQLEQKQAKVEITYDNAVRREGNALAKKTLEDVFEVCDRKWRGVGLLPKSGLRLRPEYHRFDAERRFEVGASRAAESPLCMSGHVLRGIKKPTDCPAFGKQCTPDMPLGATMVSSEGACAAYFRFGRRELGGAA
ncbi:MAG: hydrogenase formation protein HypD [Polyangiaceae bacterium]|nr:hydrogenase formation protein HypD [Polyangiaceae bacterium]